MSVEATLASARAAAESLMVDRCVVTRISGDGVFNEATGEYGAPPQQVVYSGPCQLQAPDYAVDDQEAGERRVALQQMTVKLPVATSAGIQIDDRVSPTSSMNDPDLLNRTFVVIGLHHKTYASSRRLRCSEEAD